MKMLRNSFVIVSAARSGSTALYRALNLIPGCWLAYEPMFDQVEHSVPAVRERVTNLLSDYTGFKHVCEPSGYPFQDPEQATIGEMEQDGPLWFELNSAILNHPGLRVIFLRRRNEFQRVVSHLMGRMTDLWGHTQHPMSADEPALYKKAVSNRDLPPLDENLVRWYLENIPQIFDRLRSAVTANPVIDVWYEDLFGDAVTISDRVAVFREIVNFLRLSAPEELFESPELALVLGPSGKLNDARTLEHVPNYRELCRSLGIPDDVPRRPAAPTDAAPALNAPAARMAELDLRRKWRLRAAGDENVAGLEFSAERPDMVRVVIEKAATDARFDIQLNVPDLALIANRAYTLRFRGRADKPRSVIAGVAQAHDPWQGLGLYESVDLFPEWKEFEATFVAAADDDQARVHFDLGSRAVSVELSDLTLR